MAERRDSSDSFDSLDSAFIHSEDRFLQIVEHLRSDVDRNLKQLPGLADLLDDYVNPDVPVSNVDYLQRLMKVFKDSETDGTYSSILSNYTEDERDRINAFVVDGKPIEEVSSGFQMGMSLGAREELGRLEPFSESLFDHVGDHIKTALARTFGDFNPYNDAQHKHKVDIFVDEEFQNWGRTVANKPKFTCVPQTSYGVQEVVKFAKKNNMNVRASGYRHSWSPVFGKNGQILISTLDLHRASVLPNFESLLPKLYPPGTGLSSIDFVGEPQSKQKRLVRVGTAVTNQMFRVWCNSQKVDKNLSTLPLNVIMVEITLGGSNAPICHGAGRNHPTLSDLVHAIEYVDADGNMQYLDRSNPQWMYAASGCFGLLGIVTHITLEVDAMSYAILTPQKLPIMKAIPPPPELDINDIPKPLRIEMTPEERKQAQADFEAHARDDFYSEWFWFPYTSMVWVNCWNTVDDPTGAVDFPSKLGVFEQFVQTIAIQILQVSEAVIDLQKLLPLAQATLISKLGLDVMPNSLTKPGDRLKTKLPNALHFRRAIQNVRVRDMEIEIPLIPKTGSIADAKFDSEINWTNVQRAWWDAVLIAYKHTDTCPQRMPLEMRITGPSNVLMAPYKGHKLGSCSIEVLTLENMKDVWSPYAQEVLDKWMDLRDNEGNFLPSRPHWAKEWIQFKVRGRPMLEYVRESYKDNLAQFRAALTAIVESKGGNIADTRKRFGNDMLDVLVWRELDDSVTRGEALVVGTGKTVDSHKIKAPTADAKEVKPSIGKSLTLSLRMPLKRHILIDNHSLLNNFGTKIAITQNIRCHPAP